jgi:hypothetical protein
LVDHGPRLDRHVRGTHGTGLGGTSGKLVKISVFVEDQMLTDYGSPTHRIHGAGRKMLTKRGVLLMGSMLPYIAPWILWDIEHPLHVCFFNDSTVARSLKRFARFDTPQRWQLRSTTKACLVATNIGLMFLQTSIVNMLFFVDKKM